MNKLLAPILIAASVLLPAQQAKATELSSLTPSSFASQLNSFDWGEGANTKFSYLGQCKHYRSMGSYDCFSGYVTIDSPMGTKVCELEHVWINYNNAARYRAKTCRYKN